MSVVAEVLDGGLVGPADLARILHTTPRSISRWQAAEVSPRRGSEERMLELKAVLDLAERCFPPLVARRWLRAPVPDLDYEKPLDLIADGQWRRVIDTLLAFAEGVTA